MAFAISIALHEIAAGTIPLDRSQPALRETVASARVVRITLHATPRPTATPAPRPIVTPRPVLATPTRVPFTPLARAASHPHHRTLVIHATHLQPNARPVWDTAARGPSNGAVAAAGLAAGPGTGAGVQGNGSTAASGEPPCGFVTFSDPHGSRFDTQTRGFWVDIRMSVHFADGSSQSMMLDYPWYYSSEAANPWSAQNLKDLNFPTRFQPPPAERTSSEPPLVKYVAQHSTADGMTLLRDCPAATTPGR